MRLYVSGYICGCIRGYIHGYISGVVKGGGRGGARRGDAPPPMCLNMCIFSIKTHYLMKENVRYFLSNLKYIFSSKIFPRFYGLLGVTIGKKGDHKRT